MLRSRTFFIIAALATIVSLGLVVVHQSHVNSLVDDISVKDKAAQDTATERKKLKDYVDEHMSVGSTLFLKASYDRAVAAAQAAANPTSNGQVYAAAQQACASKADSIVQARCVQSYLAAHASSNPNPQPVAMPDKAAFTFKYSGPNWTADSAGLALLAAIVFGVSGVYLLLLRR